MEREQATNDNGLAPHGRPGSDFAEDRPDKGGDKIEPGKQPDEIRPDKGDSLNPTGPAEIEVEPGDVDQPGQTPVEAPPEILSPPD